MQYLGYYIICRNHTISAVCIVSITWKYVYILKIKNRELLSNSVLPGTTFFYYFIISFFSGITRSVIQVTISTMVVLVVEQVISPKLCGKKALFLALDALKQKKKEWSVHISSEDINQPEIWEDGMQRMCCRAALMLAVTAPLLAREVENSLTSKGDRSSSTQRWQHWMSRERKLVLLSSTFSKLSF